MKVLYPARCNRCGTKKIRPGMYFCPTCTGNREMFIQFTVHANHYSG